MSEENVNEEVLGDVKKRRLHAKTASKWSMVFATVWIISLTIARGFFDFDINTNDIIYTAVTIVGIWSPTYLSIFLDKIRDIRLGGR